MNAIQQEWVWFVTRDKDTGWSGDVLPPTNGGHVVSGTLRLSIGEDNYLLGADDVAFVASGQLHGGQPDHCVYECVVFDMRLLLKSNDHCKPYIAEVLEGYVEITPHLPAGNPVTQNTLLPMFDALREQCDGYALITLGCLFQFVGEVYRFGAYQRREQPHERSHRRDVRG